MSFFFFDNGIEMRMFQFQSFQSCGAVFHGSYLRLVKTKSVYHVDFNIPAESKSLLFTRCYVCIDKYVKVFFKGPESWFLVEIGGCKFVESGVCRMMFFYEGKGFYAD